MSSRTVVVFSFSIFAHQVGIWDGTNATELWCRDVHCMYDIILEAVTVELALSLPKLLEAVNEFFSSHCSSNLHGL
jgi:hypothetical protein